MWTTRKRLRIPLRIRGVATVLVPGVWVLAAFAMSPAGAELALADNTSAAQRSTGVMYGGMTSNGWPVIVEVTRGGRRVKRVVGVMSANCSQGRDLHFPIPMAQPANQPGRRVQGLVSGLRSRRGNRDGVRGDFRGEVQPCSHPANR